MGEKRTGKKKMLMKDVERFGKSYLNCLRKYFGLIVAFVLGLSIMRSRLHVGIVMPQQC